MYVRWQCREWGFTGCGLERSRYGVSHTPHRQQCSGVRRSCWEMSQPLETAQPRLQQQQLHTAGLSITIPTDLLWNRSSLFIVTSSAPLEIYQPFLYLSQQLRMTHQKRIIYPHVGVAADELLFVFGLWFKILFNVVFRPTCCCSVQACLFVSIISTCCHELRPHAAWILMVFFTGPMINDY